MFDFTPFDHGRSNRCSLEKPQAGAANIEVDAVATQANLALHDGSGRRFEIVAAHRGVDERPDFCAINRGLVQHFLCRKRSRVAWRHASGPKTAILDAG